MPQVGEPSINAPCFALLFGTRYHQLHLYDNDGTGTASTRELLVLGALDSQALANVVKRVVQVLAEEQRPRCVFR